MRRLLAVLFAGVLAIHPALAQDGVWQWMTDLHNTSSSPKYAHPAAYLWIPEDCRTGTSHIPY